MNKKLGMAEIHKTKKTTLKTVCILNDKLADTMVCVKPTLYGAVMCYTEIDNLVF